jgi:hypothetical protein
MQCIGRTRILFEYFMNYWYNEVWITFLMCSMSLHYIIQNTNHQQVRKENFISNRNTLLHVSTLLGHLHGELFVTVTLRLHFTVEWECAVDCVLEAWTLCGPGLQAGTADRSFLQKQCSTQSTAHSHSTVKCNLRVTVTRKFSLKMTQQGRNM